MKKRNLVLSFVGILSMIAVVSAIPASQLISAKTTTTPAATAETDTEEKDDDAALANMTVALTEDQAKTIALASIQDGSFVAIELEDEDGAAVYGVTVSSGTTESDVKVDANTGDILKTEAGGDSEEIDAQDTDTEENDTEDQDGADNEDNDSTENETEVNE